MLNEDRYRPSIPAGPTARFELTVSARMAEKLSERARAEGYKPTQYAELLLQAAWSARCGKSGDPELEAVVAAVMPAPIAAPVGGADHSLLERGRGTAAPVVSETAPETWSVELLHRIHAAFREAGESLRSWCIAEGKSDHAVRGQIRNGKAGPKYRALIARIVAHLAAVGVTLGVDDLLPAQAEAEQQGVV